MITDRINALFRFIEYLHININNFTQFEPAIIELDVLRKERNKLKPNSRFTDRVKENELQLKINDKIDIIEKSISEPIRTKAKELNICDTNKTETIWNWNISDIEKIKRNFNEKDVPIIIRYKNKYIEFREKVNLSPEEIFFERLDETLRILFDYFNETEESEFEAFKTKIIRVNSFTEADELLKQGHKTVALPLNFLDLPKEPQQYNAEPRNSNTEKEKSETTLSDLITHENNTEIVKAIKIQYKNIKGKRLKLLLIALQSSNLLPLERTAQKFYNCCKREFDWNIASYTAMNDYKYNERVDETEMSKMIKFLEGLIQAK